jgi:hypothetical protein
MKKLFSKVAALIVFLFCFGVISGSAYTYGPALQGSYTNVTISVTAATSTTVKLVGGSASDRSLAVLKNIGPTYDVYWGEGASTTTVNTWKTIAAGAETTIYTCNYAPGTWGYTNKGIYIRVSPTPYTADVVQLRAYKLLR